MACISLKCLSCLALVFATGCAGGIGSGATTASATTAAFAARIESTERFAVRTRLDGPGRKEIRGMRCVLASEEVTATVETPGKVAFPTMRGRPSPMRITCSDGTYRGSILLHPGVTGVQILAPYVPGGSSAAMKAGADHPATLWVYTKAPVWVTVR